MTSKKSRKTSATPSTKNSAKAATGATGNPGDARQIDEKIKELADWRGETLRRVRELIRAAVALNVEDGKRPA